MTRNPANIIYGDNPVQRNAQAARNDAFVYMRYGREEIYSGISLLVTIAIGAWVGALVNAGFTGQKKLEEHYLQEL